MAKSEPVPASQLKQPIDVLSAQVSRRLVWAETVAVGPHVRSVKPGDKVLFNPEDRFEVEVQGEEYVILRERDIHAVASERINGGTGLYL
jgi:chaperonin GroES